MTSKVELTISTDYVPDWGVVEAFRELFQNALDNETTNPENKMNWGYKKETETMLISNKTSSLELDSLLLGSTTKRDDKDTIGQHGEGYKLAVMVLLRAGKGVTIYNYDKREVWRTRLVVSKRFNGKKIPTVFVDKESNFWKKQPEHDLIIKITGITEDEFNDIKDRNIHMKQNVIASESTKYGRILLNTEAEQGNIYVNGLFICHNDGIKYGYDLNPSVVTLDRDRRLMTEFNIQWTTSLLWTSLAGNEKYKQQLIDLINDDAPDVKYTNQVAFNNFSEAGLINDEIAKGFIEKHGVTSTPVINTEEMNRAIKKGLKPVIVSSEVASHIRNAVNTEIQTFEDIKIASLLRDFMDKIESKLSDEEIEEFNELIEKVDKLE